MIKIIGFLITLFSISVLASESCSRTATINYQDVLIDSASSLKGEGLRPYLAKDPVALSYLEVYQQNAKPSFKSSFMGTTGVVLSLLSFTVSNDHSPPWNNSVLLTTGLTLIIVNYVFNQTLQNNNESNLYQAVEEYNLRNTPKIEFNNETYNNKSPNENFLGISLSRTF